MSSLSALALLMTATGALREAVEAAGIGEDVQILMAPHESIEAAASLATGERPPILVCVFVGDETQTIVDRRMFVGDKAVELAVQVLLPPLVRLSYAGASAELDTHTAGAVAAFAFASRLVEIALGAPERSSAPDVPSWGSLYADMVLGAPSKFEALPFMATSKNGVEVPGEDYSLPCRTITSPAPGDTEAQTEGFWPELVAKAASDPHTAGLAPLVEALVAGKLAPAWRVDQIRAGLSHAEGGALGLGTVTADERVAPWHTLTLKTRGGEIVVGAPASEGA